MGQSYMHENQQRVVKRWAFFSGTTALEKGVGLCYDPNYATTARDDRTITDPWAGRAAVVAVPSAGANNMYFAGVTTQSCAANANGQWIEIYEPGSVCYVAAGVNTTAQTTYMTCSASSVDAGRFTLAGLPGRGTAMALQTTTTTALEDNWVGSTAALDATGLIITDSGATFVTNGVAAGDRVIIVQAEDDGSTAGTPGEYVVASVDAETQITLTAAASDGGTMQISYYIIRNNPLVLAYLCTGEESGLQEVISPVNNDAAQSMVGGTTFIGGTVTLGTGDSTSTLADGTIPGMKKAFASLGALTTQDWLLTVTSGIQADGTSTLATLEFDAAGDHATLVWSAIGPVTTGAWAIESLVGATQA